MENPTPITSILYSTALALLLVTATAATTTTTIDELSHSLDQWFENQKSSTTLTKQEIYIHAVFDTSSPNQTIFNVASSAEITGKSGTNFGLAIAIDNPLTTGPDPGSHGLGHYQGICVYSDLKQVATAMNMNFIFPNGSTLTVMGRQPVNDKVRVMSIIGGTGGFRLARGIVLASTYSTDSHAQTGVYVYVMYILTPTTKAVSPQVA